MGVQLCHPLLRFHASDFFSYTAAGIVRLRWLWMQFLFLQLVLGSLCWHEKWIKCSEEDAELDSNICCAKPITVGREAVCLNTLDPSILGDFSFFFFFFQANKPLLCDKALRGLEVTDDIFKCVTFPSLPFTFSPEVRALTSVWQFC